MMIDIKMNKFEDDIIDMFDNVKMIFKHVMCLAGDSRCRLDRKYYALC